MKGRVIPKKKKTEEEKKYDKARKYAITAGEEAKINPDSYGHMNPHEIRAKSHSVWPTLEIGIPELVGYYWCVDDLDRDWPKVTLVFVNDGKVWTFGGTRIPNPQAEKMWFQNGIVPPFPTADFKRDGRYFTTTLPGEGG